MKKMKMKVTGGASATTGLTRRQQLEAGKEYGQILPTAEAIMKNENKTWSLGSSKAHKKAAAGERQGVPTDPPSSGGHYEKIEMTGGISTTTRLIKRQMLEEPRGRYRSSQQRRSL